VRVVDTFPADSHEPITYPAAATRRGSADAVAFLQFLRGAEAQTIFRKYGFGIPEA
jgi:molybdate transport system substrate-binding protein